MQFNFNRSFVLSSLRTDGDAILITRAFHGGVVRIPRSRVQCRVANKLDDSSVRVVDFGEAGEGMVPQEAIIGVGHESKVFTL